MSSRQASEAFYAGEDVRPGLISGGVEGAVEARFAWRGVLRSRRLTPGAGEAAVDELRYQREGGSPRPRRRRGPRPPHGRDDAGSRRVPSKERDPFRLPRSEWRMVASRGPLRSTAMERASAGGSAGESFRVGGRSICACRPRRPPKRHGHPQKAGKWVMPERKVSRA